ncbi:hypothetical protein [Halobaculum magnesiiphilum]|uniref:Repressor phrH2 n=1 Tax=Halobaculum magnesiiphilum TaxID=1017351 RepID=A0A8T8WD65_9EURY|nr:hypothetical protein [Halobaculum magnesiiphilum]QZP37771.1 hypothetical protein K6T50_00895 [Halobaculum magnesiiphilum]
MQLVDERILERLAGEGDGTAWMIAFDLNRNRGRVAERCRVLAHAGFVDRVPRAHVDDKWVITDWGRLYLDGEIDADLRRPSPSPRPPDKVRPGWYAGFG